MSEFDVEKKLEQLSERWPGKSVASEVSERLAIASDGGTQTGSKSWVLQAGIWQMLRISSALATSLVLVAFGVWFLLPQREWKDVMQESLKDANSWHVVESLVANDKEQQNSEYWYVRGKGVRVEQVGRVEIDDGEVCRTKIRDESGDKFFVRPSIDLETWIRGMFDLAAVPEQWRKTRVEELDKTVAGRKLRAFAFEFDELEGVRVQAFLDEKSRPREVRFAGLNRLADSERVLRIDYEDVQSESLFEMEIPSKARVVDTRQILEQKFPLDASLGVEEKDGLIMAVHEAVALVDQSYFMVTSVRASDDYLKKYPPKKRRINRDWISMDVASQVHSHGSRGAGSQIMILALEWQGIDYLWWIFVPHRQARPSNGAEEGALRVPFFVSHWHEKQKDERGVQNSTSCDIDVPVKVNSPKDLDDIVALFFEDLDQLSVLRSVIYKGPNEVGTPSNTLQLARSLENDAVHFAPFSDFIPEQYAFELRKTRWQLENGDGSGKNPPEGFELAFQERWEPPEDPTKDFEDREFELPPQVKGRVVDESGVGIANAQVTLEVERYHPTKSQSRPPNAVWTTTSNGKGEYVFELDGAINQKYDEVSLRVMCANYATKTEYDYLKMILNGELPEVCLWNGCKITGQIVDANGKPATKTVVRFQANDPDLVRTWDSGPVTVNADGTFMIEAPTKTQTAAAVYPEGHAPRFIEASELLTDAPLDLGEIKLAPGKSYSGRVLDENGAGVANTIVEVSHERYVMLHAFMVPIGLAVKTDASGRFQLPPLDGRYTLQVAESAPVFSKRIQVFGAKPPKIDPWVLDTNEYDIGSEILLAPEQ